VAQGDLELDAKDYPAAIDAYSRAISVKDAASPDDNVLTAYAGRAEAEAALQRYPDEIADLRFVTENYPRYNTAEQSDLDARSHYHELLAKALYRTHDEAAAAGELMFVDKPDLDWEDLQFLAGRSVAAKDWPTAIDQLKRALGEMPDDAALKPRKAQIEVTMAQAYEASGDPIGALDHFRIAEAYDPANADALAGHQRIGDPPPPPTFEDPVLEPVNLPAGVSDLAQDSPPPFCGQAAKNAYLDSVNAATEAVNANVTTIGLVSADLLKRRAVYDAETRLSYEQKLKDLALFDAQLKQLHDQSTTLYATGQALLAFFHRINDDRSNVTTCRQGASAAGG
jgi:tetratricopeptide (TPR) repeat protein